MLAAYLLLIVLSTAAIDAIGRARLAALAYALYTAIFRPHRELDDLRAKTAATRDEFRSTSSQDQFARWARLRRTLDRQSEQIEKLSSSAASHQTSFSAIFTSFLWILTTFLPFLFTSYHKASPVVYLPPVWFGPVSSWLALPFAPVGALSCTVFVFCARRSLRLFARALSMS